MSEAGAHQHHGRHGGHAPAEGVKDPVCGMSVDPHTARHTAMHAGRPYYFCCARCREKFLADPEKYLSPQQARAEPVPEGTIYTCPMHPEIRRVGPGACPICGMALEPELVTAETGPNPELADMTRRLWIGVVLTLPVLALEMGGHLVDLHALVRPQTSNWIQLVLATPVVLWAGWPFFERGWASVRTGNLNMFTLIAMGTGVAWAYSIVATLLPGLFPPALRTLHGAVPVYFEAAAVITVLVLLGQVLELKARERTSGAIRALLDLAPKRARRLRPDGGDEEVDLEAVEVGDRLRVRPGDSVPVDGELLEGRSSVDESMVTGESMPVTKEAGAKLIGGTLNQSGSFVMRADKVGRETMLARIVQMVAEAQRSRAPIQRLADQVSGWFVPLVIAVAALAFLAWSIWGPEPRFTFALIAAVSVLIIACPVRAGSRHAHVDHGGRRPRRPQRRAHQERRSPGTVREGRHHRRRQDRHADRGQAQGGGRAPGPRAAGAGARPAGGEPGARQPASARGGDRRGGARARPHTGGGEGLRRSRRQGRHRRGGGPAPRDRQPAHPRGSRHRRGWAGRADADRLRQDGATVVLVAIDGKAAGASPSPIPSRPPRQARWPR